MNYDEFRSSETAPARPTWLPTLGVWILVFGLVWMMWRPEGASSPNNLAARPQPVVARGDLAADEQANIDVFKTASPSVVYITTTDVARDFFSLNPVEVPRGSGTGFLYNNQGHIVTNMHVISQGRRWTVTLADGTQWSADFVGATPDKDLAVLKIDAPSDRLTPILLGTSSDLQVGQKVYAIGNPFGLDRTLTTGIVSALGREIDSLNGRPIRDVIQTDAAINPGNSGGPLLDSAARLIGVNTQIASTSGASAGIGFAIPVDTVNRVVPELIRHGKVIRPILGVIPWPQHVTRQMGMEGVLLRDVPESSAAGQAGLRGTIITRDGNVRQIGDLVLKINADPTPDQNALFLALERYQVGDEVTVSYRRDDTVRETKLRLQAGE